MTDPVNHPQHYKSPNGLEAIDVIEGFRLGFHLGNAVKYVLRAGKKDSAVQDIRKAGWYLNRFIEKGEPDLVACKAAIDLAYFRLCYLATPYSKYQGGDIEAAFVRAAEIAAVLLTCGVRVYSPIAHTHPLAIYGKLDALDHSIWLPFDQAMMDASDCLVVAHMDGWDESYGVKHEIDVFAKEGKPIYHLNPQTMTIIRGEAA